jgi:hypothetical protein
VSPTTKGQPIASGVAGEDGQTNIVMNAESNTVEGQSPLAAASSPPTGKLSDPERWVGEYGDYLFKYALSRLRDPAKAEDMVQEAFLAALKGAKGFQGRSAEKSWLVGILKNKICDHFRRSLKKRFVVWIWNHTPNCAQMSRLASQSFEEPLPLGSGSRCGCIT